MSTCSVPDLEPHKRLLRHTASCIVRRTRGDKLSPTNLCAPRASAGYHMGQHRAQQPNLFVVSQQGLAGHAVVYATNRSGKQGGGCLREGKGLSPPLPSRYQPSHLDWQKNVGPCILLCINVCDGECKKLTMHHVNPQPPQRGCRAHKTPCPNRGSRAPRARASNAHKISRHRSSLPPASHHVQATNTLVPVHLMYAVRACNAQPLW